MTDELTIDVEDLRHRLASATTPEAATLRGFRVRGTLDFSHLTLRTPITLERCELLDGLDVQGARIAGLVVTECAVSTVDARQIRATGLVSFAGSDIDEVRLDDARVSGHVDLSRLGRRRDRVVTLHAPRAVIDGDLLAQGAVVLGGIDLTGSRIAGELNLDGAEVQAQRSEAGASLVLDRGTFARVSCEPLAAQRFVSVGEIRALHASVDGEIRLRGASLRSGDTHPGQPLSCDGLTCDRLLCDWVATDAFPDGIPFEADGEIRLPGAQIASRLSFVGAQLAPGEDGDVIYAEQARIGWLDAGAMPGSPLRAQGRICLTSAQIDGSVWLDGAELSAGMAARLLDMERAQVRGSLSLSGATLEAGSPEQPSIWAPDLDIAEIRCDPGAPVTCRGALRLARSNIRIRVDLAGSDLSRVDLVEAKMGRLGLADTTLTGSLELADAVVTYECDLSGALLKPDAADSLLGDGASFGRLLLRESRNRPFRARSTVRLVAAEIATDLVVRGASLSASTGAALVLQRASAPIVTFASGDGRTTVEGGIDAAELKAASVIDLRGALLMSAVGPALTLDDAHLGAIQASQDADGRPFECRGSMRAARATVSGPVDLVSCRLDGRGAVGLDLTRTQGVDLLCRSQGDMLTEVLGGVRLQGATFTGQVDFSGARLRADGEGDSLIADSAHVGSLLLGASRHDERHRFEAEGSLRLPSASVIDELVLAGADLRAHGDEPALLADDAQFGTVIGSTEEHPLRASGQLRFVGARITQTFGLAHARIRAQDDALLMTGCSVGTEIDLIGAWIRSEHYSAIQADRVTCGDVHAGDGTDALSAEGTVSFEASTIHGQLVLDGASISSTRDPLVLRDADIALVSIAGAHLHAGSGAAVSAQRLKSVRVLAGPSSERGLRAMGSLRLQGARIEEEFSLFGAHVEAESVALDLSRATCPVVEIGPDGANQSLLIGELQLTGGTFADRVSIGGVRLRARQDAISADRATIGSLSLRDMYEPDVSTQIFGRVRLLGATITGQLVLDDIALITQSTEAAVDASGATIGELWLRPHSLRGSVVLLGATARRFLTAATPEEVYKELELEGFAYERWDAMDDQSPPRGWQLTMLSFAHGRDKSVEPYERLAGVLRAAGEEQTARQALAQRERLVTRQERGALRRRHGRRRARVREALYAARRMTYDAVVGYGYGEGRALMSLVAVFVVALAVTHVAVSDGDIRLRTTTATTCVNASGASAPCTPQPSSAARAEINELVFAAERVIPAVDLGERARVIVVGWSGTVLAICSLLGWVLTIALLAAAAKTLRRD